MSQPQEVVVPQPETGSILFDCRWREAPATSGPHMQRLLHWREELYKLDLIGMDERGIGFGNLSCRVEGHEPFFISGTGTGCKKRLSPTDFTQVTAWNYEGNWLECRGPCRASSESLSHAAVYEELPQARAVIHVHHPVLWQALYMRIPTTHPQAEAGKPEMAWAIGHLLAQGCEGGVFVMGGHQDGLMAFGADLEEAGQRLVDCFHRLMD